MAGETSLPEDFQDRRVIKSSTAFRTITEVAEELDLPQHVLRFWESKFPQVKPLKRAGGRRYYRPEDVELLRRIRKLLHEDGLTIKGVQKLLHQNAGKAPETGLTVERDTQEVDLRMVVRRTLGELEELRDLLRKEMTRG